MSILSYAALIDIINIFVDKCLSLANILIIDDEERLRDLLKRIITLEGYEVRDASTLASARQLLEKSSVDIVLCDVKLPDGNGVDFTKELKEKHPNIEVILLTAYGNIPDGVQAIKNGAFDYIVKGDDNDKILPLLSRAADKAIQRQQIKRLEKPSNHRGFDSVIGKSTLLKSAIQLAQKAAPTDVSVLLTGETGTGKEVFAQAIHFSSLRADHPFIAINCSAFSKELLESELFGHKAGAFTGAIKDKKGLVEEAKGGTLFLDELGEMSIDLQPKLLRLLENGTFMRVGDTKEQKTDIRVIAATNKNLHSEIEKGSFRNDLYYRVAVFTVELPALRDRVADIPILVAHFLSVYSAKIGKSINTASKGALDILKHSDWRGNVRQLKNVIERAVIMEDNDVLTVNSLPIEMQATPDQSEDPKSTFQLSTIEKLHIQKVLLHTKGNKAEAARLLNIGLATLYRKIDEYHLK